MNQVIDITRSDRWRVTRLHKRWRDAEADETRTGAPPGRTRAAYDAWAAACNEMAAKLARVRGWTVARTPFGVEQLARGRAGRYTYRERFDARHRSRIIDHAEHFRWPIRPFRPAAILTHAYASADEIQAFADEHGLACERLPWSWYNPTECVAALLTRADNVPTRPAA